VEVFFFSQSESPPGGPEPFLTGLPPARAFPLLLACPFLFDLPAVPPLLFPPPAVSPGKLFCTVSG